MTHTNEQERAEFERELIDNHHYVPSDFSFKDGFYGGDDDYIQFGWDLWQAARRAPAAPVPQGWKLVPMEPTPEQLLKVYKQTGVSRKELADLWTAMLAAAPQPPEAAPVQMPTPDGYIFQHEETGITQFVDAQQVEWGFEKNNPRWKRAGSAYTEQQVRQLLAAHGIQEQST